MLLKELGFFWPLTELNNFAKCGQQNNGVSVNLHVRCNQNFWHTVHQCHHWTLTQFFCALWHKKPNYAKTFTFKKLEQDNAHEVELKFSRKTIDIEQIFRHVQYVMTGHSHRFFCVNRGIHSLQRQLIQTQKNLNETMCLKLKTKFHAK